MALAVWLRRWMGVEAQGAALHALGSQHDALCAQVAAQADRLAALERDAERMAQSVAKCVLAAELAQRSEARMRARLEQGGGAWGVGLG